MAVSASRSSRTATAILEGVVMDKDNNDLRLEIHLFFEGRTMGADWAGGFKNDYGCAVNTDLWRCTP